MSGFCSFNDVDGTTASYFEVPPKAEIEARKEVFDFAHRQGGHVLSTLRASEMCMDEHYLEASIGCGLGRLPPLCAKKDGHCIYAPLSSLERFKFNYNPHAINSVGVGIVVEQGGAYHHDLAFQHKLHPHVGERWRDRALKLVDTLDHDGLLRGSFAPIEDIENYHAGKTDVAPLDYRIQLQYEGGDGIGWKNDIKQRINQLRHERHSAASFARAIRWIDESRPHKQRYMLYLVPKYGTKEHGVTQVYRSIVAELEVDPGDIMVVVTGDTMTDLRAGIFGAPEAPGFFVLAGGSPLTDYLVGSKSGEPFAGESLESIRRRMKPNSKKGFYYVQMPGMPFARVVVVADQAFPGKSDAESILAFYQYWKSYTKSH